MAGYGLIGERLGHSFSPQVHRFFADYDYRLIELAPEALAPFLRERAFSGVNVTIPYKRAVMPLCDALSDEAARIGSVNTIVNDGGRLTGYNTDYYGLRRMAEAAGIPFSGRKALILGSGGAARRYRLVWGAFHGIAEPACSMRSRTSSSRTRARPDSMPTM